jgi:hypothetical protein
LILLGATSPGSWSELILVLSKCVVESSRIGDFSSGSDEFDHLSPFDDVDRPGLVFVVVLWERDSDNFFQYARRQTIEEKSYGLLITDSVASLSYQIFEV